MVALAIRDDVLTIERAKTQASRISVATDAMTRVARAVEYGWDDLPECDRELLRELARLLASPPPPGIAARVKFAFWKAFSNMDEVTEFVLAGARLHESLLNVVEREHAGYDAFVADALAGALGTTHATIAPRQIGDWLSSIRDPS